MKIHDLEAASNDRQSASADDRGEAMRTEPALAPMVGASLEAMECDSGKMRGVRPFGFTRLRTGQRLDRLARFIRRQGLML